MEQTVDVLDWAYGKGIQIILHANGEGASEMPITAVYATTKKYGPADHRPVIIHGQFLCEDEASSWKRF